MFQFVSYVILRSRRGMGLDGNIYWWEIFTGGKYLLVGNIYWCICDFIVAFIIIVIVLFVN